MSFPKIRFTWGNLVGLVVGAASIAVDNSAEIAKLSPVGGGKLLAASAIILGVTKGVASFNHDTIPDDKKAETTGVLFEKTGPLKPTA